MRRTIDSIGTDFPKQCDVVRSIDDLSVDSSTPERMLESVKTEITSRFPIIDQNVDFSISDDERAELPSVYCESGQSSEAEIQIHETTLTDPLRTVSELANQYSTHFWHASGQIEPNEVHPNLCHLMPICCGFGVLASDAAFYDSQTSVGGWHRWSMSRSGFYNATEIGYASALLARHRNENDPTWLPAMRLDSRETTKKAFRYFDDCDRNRRPILFDADKIPSSMCDPADLAAWLQGDDPAFALAAAYALLKQDKPSSFVIEAAMQIANAPNRSANRAANRELAPFAIRLIGRSCTLTDDVRQLIEKSVSNRNHAISIAAIKSADALGMPLAPYRKRITELLHAYAEGSNELIELVAKGGSEFTALEGLICQHLAEATLYSNQQATVSLVDCLHQISSDPKSVVVREIGDPELKDRILQLVDSS